MKKSGSRMPGRIPASLTKCLLIMKLTILLTCLFSLQSMAMDTYGQENVTLKLQNASLKKAFKLIEKQTSFRFVYNDDILPEDQRVNIDVRQVSVFSVMQKLLDKTPLSFMIIGTDLVVISGEDRTDTADPKPVFPVTGKVRNMANQPMANVSILEKGTNNGTTTKEDGSFQINTQSENAILVISYVGYAPLEIATKGRNTISVQLQEDVKEIDQVVVVGYGTQKRSDITGSVSSVPKARLSQLPVTNIYQAIEGSVAGVSITQNSSVPGSGATARIRGVNSINASRSPFIVVDGIPFSTTGGSINDINSNDIASIEILKDASAVAIYGTRGSNGVILITTKRGATGKPIIRYNGYIGMEDLGHKLDPRSPSDYVQKYADYWKQINPTTPQTAILPNAYEIANYNAGKTVDWIDEATQQGIIQDHNLSIAGGTKDVRYYISGDYLKQKGVVRGYQYQRASIRSNLDINVTDYLSIGTSLSYANNNYDGGRANFYLAASMSPYGSLYNSSNSFEIYPMYPELLYANPLLGLYVDQRSRSNNLTGNFYAELKPTFVKGLKYRINVADSYVPANNASYTGRNANNTIGSATTGNSSYKNWIIENILTYNRDWKLHHIDFTGLYSAQQTNYLSTGASATGFINDQLSYNNLGAGATQTASSSQWKSNLLSQMGRINYSYDSRYLFTVTARRDGYSAFGNNTNKYGVFPSAAVGWNISNESFMKNVAFVSNLKLRASYGKSGNQAIDPNGTTTADASVRFPFNGVSTIGVLASILGNRNLKWETTKGLNAGLDFAILKSRITGTIEFYKTRTEDIILKRNLPAATGFSSVFDNLGKLDNHGIEITLNTQNVHAGDFRWESNINFSSNKNKIVELYGDGKSDLGNRWFIGQPLFVIYDYQMQGVWQVGEDASQQDPGVKPGDLKFADINDSKTVTAADKMILGSTLPKWIGGLTNTFHYRNWHLNIFIQTFQGALKNDVNLTFADEAGRMNTPREIGYWTADNKSNTRPALSYTNTRGYGYPSDNSYTRIKDVTLSYSASQPLLDKLKVGSLTFYLSGRNLYTFTKWVGWDPENDFSFRGSGDWTNNYPFVRSFVLGANVTLR